MASVNHEEGSHRTPPHWHAGLRPQPPGLCDTHSCESRELRCHRPEQTTGCRKAGSTPDDLRLVR